MNIYDFEPLNNKLEKTSLSIYKGKVILVVNTAIKCGFTPQYKALQDLYAKYEKDGLVILDFPCNQFLFQAPGSDEDIDKFVTSNYHTTFPRFHKIDVNGKNEDPLYTYLKSQKEGRITWNFNKFLINQEGVVVKRYDSKVKPEEIEADITNLLKVAPKEVKKEYPPVKEIKGLTLFSLVGCPHCKIAKDALAKAGIEYTDLSYGDPTNHSTFHEYGIKQVPVLLVEENGKFVKIESEQKIIAWIHSKGK
jgi:glutathione peroxidase